MFTSFSSSIRLLAGKFEPVCTEFPLTTFLYQKITGVPLKFLNRKKNQKDSLANISPPMINAHHLVFFKKICKTFNFQEKKLDFRNKNVQFCANPE